MIMRANYFIAKKIVGIDGEIRVDKYIELVNKNLNNILFELRNDVKHVLLCYDTKSFRYKVYDQYKSGRNEDLVFQDLADRFFKSSNFDYVKIGGLEADDLLYLLSNGNSIIVSNDHDLKLADSLLFSPTLKKFLLSDEPDPYELILKGCGSDTIPKLIPRFSKSMVSKLPKYEDQSIDDLVENISLYFNLEPADVLRNIELVLYREETYLKYVPLEYRSCLEYRRTLSTLR